MTGPALPEAVVLLPISSPSPRLASSSKLDSLISPSHGGLSGFSYLAYSLIYLALCISVVMMFLTVIIIMPRMLLKLGLHISFGTVHLSAQPAQQKPAEQMSEQTRNAGLEGSRSLSW